MKNVFHFIHFDWNLNFLNNWATEEMMWFNSTKKILKSDPFQPICHFTSWIKKCSLFHRTARVCLSLFLLSHLKIYKHFRKSNQWHFSGKCLFDWFLANILQFANRYCKNKWLRRSFTEISIHLCYIVNVLSSFSSVEIFDSIYD